MKTDFWHRRWQQKEIGFHNEEPNTYLMAHWPALDIPNDSFVFVPLCGKSRDMLWLAEQGHKVLGVELSEIAVREFFEEAGIEPIITEEDSLVQYASPDISIYCGDLFALEAQHLSGVRAIFDRGALVALPLQMRQRYITHLRNHLPSNISGLLITMEYDQASMQGPPFSVSATEVLTLFRGFENVTDIAIDDIEFRDRTVRMRIWQFRRH